MPVPEIVLQNRTYDNLSDSQFRDVYGRNTRHVAPSSNIINKLYHHVSGNTANVSAAEVVSIDASNQGQWDLLLGTSARRLDANTITTQNTASWSANSIISIRSANTTIRSANVIVGNLNATTITGNVTGNQPGITSVGTLGSLSVTGTATAASIGGTLTTAAQPNITSVGTLGTLSVSGNVTAGNLSTNAISATAITGTLSTASQPNITSVGTLNSLAVTNSIAAANLTLGGDMNLATGIADVRNFRVTSECYLNSNVSGTAVSSSVTSGSSALVTSGGVYSAINLVSGGALGKLDAFNTLSVGISTKPGTFTAVGDAEFNTRTYEFKTVVSASDQSWVGLCYGDGLFVAVSESTANPGVMTSTDGRMWFSRTAAPSTGNAWKAVAYGNGLYVAIASNGSIMRSTGNTTWTAVRTDTVVRWTSIAYGNNLFVAVSSDNTVLVGDNTATTWTTNTGIANQAWTSVVFGGFTFVAVASSGTGIRVATSTNGSTWTSRTTPADLAWKAVGYGDGAFVAVADAGADRIMTSYDDGVTWSLRTNPVSLAWKSVAYGDSLWIAVASDGVGNGIMTSTDNGLTWTTRKPPVDLAWDAIAFGDSTFVAVAASGTGNRAMVLSTDLRTDLLSIDGSSPRMDIVSPDLSIAATTTTIRGNLAVTKVTGTTNSFNWTHLNSPAANQWTWVTYGNGQFVAVSSTGVGNRAMTSLDGTTWTSRKSPADMAWSCVAYGNLTYVAVASSVTGQRVMTSPDGVNWTQRASATDTHTWQAVAYGAGKFVAVASTTGSNNVMVSSDNGATWTMMTPSTTTQAWLRIAYGNGIFMVVASGGTVMTWDGTGAWTTRSSSLASVTGLTFGAGLFVVVQSLGTNRLSTSIDGATWTGYPIPANSWRSVTYGNGLFVAVSSSGTNRVVYSNDGITWTAPSAPSTTPPSMAWISVAYGGGKFVAVTDVSGSTTYNRIMTSPGFADVATTSSLFDINTANNTMTMTGNVGVTGSLTTANLMVTTEMRVGVNTVTGRYVEMAADTANNAYVDFHSLDGSTSDYDSRIISQGGTTGVTGYGSLIFQSNGYRFAGAPYNDNTGNVSTGIVSINSYPRYPSTATGSIRAYTMANRFWSGKMTKATAGTYDITCFGNGNFPLYGTYTVQYMTKAGTYANYIAACFQGTAANPGITNFVQWSTLSQSSNGGGTLTVTFTSVNWCPVIRFLNNSAYHAWFQVSAVVFEDGQTMYDELGS